MLLLSIAAFFSVSVNTGAAEWDHARSVTSQEQATSLRATFFDDHGRFALLESSAISSDGIVALQTIYGEGSTFGQYKLLWNIRHVKLPALRTIEPNFFLVDHGEGGVTSIELSGQGHPGSIRGTVRRLTSPYEMHFELRLRGEFVHSNHQMALLTLVSGVAGPSLAFAPSQACRDFAEAQCADFGGVDKVRGGSFLGFGWCVYRCKDPFTVGPVQGNAANAAF